MRRLLALAFACALFAVPAAHAEYAAVHVYTSGGSNAAGATASIQYGGCCGINWTNQGSCITGVTGDCSVGDHDEAVAYHRMQATKVSCATGLWYSDWQSHFLGNNNYTWVYVLWLTHYAPAC